MNTHAAPAILVAEDDFLIRSAIVDVLTDAGFAVVEMDRADSALDFLRTHAGEVQALFTDVNMPGPMDGLELARRTHAAFPWIAIIVASGRPLPSRDSLPPASRFLAKPYNLLALPGQLCALLHGERRDQAR